MNAPTKRLSTPTKQPHREQGYRVTVYLTTADQKRIRDLQAIRSKELDMAVSASSVLRWALADYVVKFNVESEDGGPRRGNPRGVSMRPISQ